MLETARRWIETSQRHDGAAATNYIDAGPTTEM
jgi:hypothetical protein